MNTTTLPLVLEVSRSRGPRSLPLSHFPDPEEPNSWQSRMVIVKSIMAPVTFQLGPSVARGLLAEVTN